MWDSLRKGLHEFDDFILSDILIAVFSTVKD